MASINLTVPSATGLSWAKGTSHDIKWTSVGLTATARIRIQLYKGGTWKKTIVETDNDGVYTWAIPSGATAIPIVGGDYKIKLESVTTPVVSDWSNNNFAIAASSGGGVTDSITVTSPHGGESWQRGTTHNITWSKTGDPGANVKIELLRAAGTVVAGVIAASTSNDGTFAWTISSSRTAGTGYKVRITSITKTSVSNTSNGYFAIVAAPGPGAKINLKGPDLKMAAVVVIIAVAVAYFVNR